MDPPCTDRVVFRSLEYCILRVSECSNFTLWNARTRFDIVELWMIYYTSRKCFVARTENGPLKGNPAVGALFFLIARIASAAAKKRHCAKKKTCSALIYLLTEKDNCTPCPRPQHPRPLLSSRPRYGSLLRNFPKPF